MYAKLQVLGNHPVKVTLHMLRGNLPFIVPFDFQVMALASVNYALLHQVGTIYMQVASRQVD